MAAASPAFSSLPVLGGSMDFRHEWRNGRWRFNPDWADLGFEREGYSPDEHPDAILRGSH